jgi:sterol desaturase/sphingolipid hydroxylase (fatty acid hydroxylase superfamily)
VHHKVFHGIKSYQLDEINRGDVLLNTEELMRNALFYLVPAIPIFMLNKTLGIVFFSVSFLYNVWEEFVHLNFHKKTDIFIVNLKFFQNLKEHHRVHHYIYNSNFGIGTSFWDIMFRTKKQG